MTVIARPARQNLKSEPNKEHGARLLRPDPAGVIATPTSDRVPICSEGTLTAFIRRAAQHPEPSRSVGENARPRSSDARLRHDITAAVRKDVPEIAEYIRVSVEGGVVLLSGEVESVHDKMALRRIAAHVRGTLAIVDNVWISCE